MGKLDFFVDMLSGNDKAGYREKAVYNTPSNHGWYKCHKCGKSYRLSDMDADHIIPRSCGGGNNPGNLQMICKHCNRRKGARDSNNAADLVRNAERLAQNRREREDTVRDFLKWFK